VQPVFSHVEPVFAVRDIPETLQYWKQVLGFPGTWTWGDPPTHAGVSWQKVFIQFYQHPERAAASSGNSIWIRLQHIEALYAFHQQNNAVIVSPLENKPWGVAEYIVREVNGYYIHFAASVEERQKSAATLPPTIRIIQRKPTVKESQRLLPVSEDSPINNTIDEQRLAAATFGMIAEDTASGEIVGQALLITDHASFYYIKDVAVRPDWQGKRIGTALMQALNEWIDNNAPDKALVALIARETLEPFYIPFGFFQAFSMIRYVQHSKKKE
jgi:GNAT superfamily N-acetyltransferase/uncharacterized glyoxalase superfamily protein PhnB